MSKNAIRNFLFDTSVYKNNGFMDAIEKYGAFAELLYLRILVRTAFTNGYYLEWDEEAVRSFARREGFHEESIDNIKECVYLFVKSRLFNKEMFNNCDILTNREIQSKWRNYKRKCHSEYTINTEYWIDLDELEDSDIEQENSECPLKRMSIRF